MMARRQRLGYSTCFATVALLLLSQVVQIWTLETINPAALRSAAPETGSSLTVRRAAHSKHGRQLKQAYMDGDWEVYEALDYGAIFQASRMADMPGKKYATQLLIQSLAVCNIQIITHHTV